MTCERRASAEDVVDLTYRRRDVATALGTQVATGQVQHDPELDGGLRNPGLPEVVRVHLHTARDGRPVAAVVDLYLYRWDGPGRRALGRRPALAGDVRHRPPGVLTPLTGAPCPSTRTSRPGSTTSTG